MISKTIFSVVGFFLLLSLHSGLGFSLTLDEKNTIQIFDQSVNSVVFITNVKRAKDFRFGEKTEIPRGTGSGFIWNDQGYIVTNYHVVRGGSIFYVKLRKGKRYRAQLIGSEPRKDLAVLKIDSKTPLTPIKVGSSKSLTVGQKALAIGNPYGLDHTLTVGVISALDREIQGFQQVTIRDVIQTDASINPGNSGGPLLDSHGELIGMNTAIYSTSGASAGIGFAVPVDTIKQMVPQIIEHGEVIQPGLGISIYGDSTTHQIAGVAIKSVEPGSAASKSGLKGMVITRFGEAQWGDIIIGVNDKRISTYNELYHQLGKHKVGDTIKIKILRGSQEIDLPVRLQKI